MEFKNKIVFGGGQKMTFGDVGILGLSFKSKGEFGTSIFEQAVDEGHMDLPIFTTYLTKCRTVHCPKGGMITFGAEDKQNCGEVKTWVDIVPGEMVHLHCCTSYYLDSMHWAFKMDAFKVNGRRMAGPAQAMTDTGCK
jgi:hypothetical protein